LDKYFCGEEENLSKIFFSCSWMWEKLWYVGRILIHPGLFFSNLNILARSIMCYEVSKHNPGRVRVLKYFSRIWCLKNILLKFISQKYFSWTWCSKQFSKIIFSETSQEYS
jgi:hypothetical protein